VVGGVIGGVSAIALALALAFFLRRKNQRRSKNPMFELAPFSLPPLDLEPGEPPIAPMHRAPILSKSALFDNDRIEPSRYEVPSSSSRSTRPVTQHTPEARPRPQSGHRRTRKSQLPGRYSLLRTATSPPIVAPPNAARARRHQRGHPRGPRSNSVPQETSAAMLMLANQSYRIVARADPGREAEETELPTYQR